MDTYGAGFAVIWIALWEVVALMWIYGVCNFSKVSHYSEHNCILIKDMNWQKSLCMTYLVNFAGHIPDD